MRCFPIIPIWLMLIVMVFLTYLIINKKNIKKSLIDISIIILLFIVNLRIMIPNGKTETITNNLDVYFIVDNTISMDAMDYKGNQTRLSGAKKDLKYIVNNLSGAKFSIITFNNTTKVITPLTKDNNMTIEAIEIINTIDELYARGSSLNTPRETIEKTLKETSKKDNRKKILFFISDGEITDDSRLKSYSNIKKYIDDGAILGYGTTKGAYIKQYDRYLDKEEYIMDTSNGYKKAISKLDENNLKKIAKDTGLDYIYMEKQENIDKKLKDISKLIKTDTEEDNKTSYDDTYYLLILPLLFLITIKFKNIKGGLL